MYHVLGFHIVSRAISRVITRNFTCYHVIIHTLSRGISHDESLVVVVVNVESSSGCCNIVTSYTSLEFYILLKVQLLFLELIVYQYYNRKRGNCYPAKVATVC